VTSIERIEASAYRIPTDAPEADGTFSWDATTLVLVQAHADGVVGTGWTYGAAACADVVNRNLAPLAVGIDVLDVGRAWSAMVDGLRNIGRPGIGGMALSAVDIALWDLKARVVGLPLHRLIGAVHDSVSVYGSGGFTSYDERQLAAQLSCWVGDFAIPRVKIKIAEHRGRAVARDLARIEQARTVIGPDIELFVDANGGYTVGQAIRLGHRFDELDVRWFEEPVSSDHLAEMARVRDALAADVAAGEYGWDVTYAARMIGAGAVDCLQADVTRCGGITELLRIAAAADAAGLQVSGHCAPHAHVAALTAVPNLRHLEWFHDHVRIENMLFDGTLDPTGGTLTPRDDPGHGLTWRADVAGQFAIG
jgi:L-alanine-DL-glutamate epimerase-like enolase superfamily enzyme